MTEIERELGRDSARDTALRYIQPLLDAEALVQARLAQGGWSEGQQAQAQEVLALLAQAQWVLCEVWQRCGAKVDAP